MPQMIETGGAQSPLYQALQGIAMGLTQRKQDEERKRQEEEVRKRQQANQMGMFGLPGLPSDLGNLLKLSQAASHGIVNQSGVTDPSVLFAPLLKYFQ